MTIDASRTTIADVVRIFADYRAKPENDTWGSLHAVLDDGNISDSDVRLCIERAQVNDDEDGIALGRILLTLTKTQRKNLPSAVERSMAERGFVSTAGFRP